MIVGRNVSFLLVVLLVFLTFNPKSYGGEGNGEIPENATFSTLITTPLNIQGLTVGQDGNFYAAGRNTAPGVACPIWRIDPDDPSLVVVGYVPAPSATASCVTIGTVMNRFGDLFVVRTTDGLIFSLTPDADNPPTATQFATTAPFTAMMTIDRQGNLWATDGPSNLGRVWKIPSTGGAATVAFRVPTMRNTIGVGRDTNRFPLGNALGLGVATGIVFDDDGDLLISDLARGVIWKAELNRDGSLRSPTGCDTTYPADTLCMDSVLVQHPILSGVAGMVIDRSGNIWVAVIDRNAMAVVSRHGEVKEVFRSPPSATTGLRNEGPLEFPAIPVLLDGMLCVSNLDSDVQDNSPNTGGETSPAPGSTVRGKITCMDRDDHHRGNGWWWHRFFD